MWTLNLDGVMKAKYRVEIKMIEITKEHEEDLAVCSFGEVDFASDAQRQYDVAVLSLREFIEGNLFPLDATGENVPYAGDDRETFTV